MNEALSEKVERNVDWKQEIENIKLRIDRCERIANTLKNSLASLLKEIKTCENIKLNKNIIPA